MGIDVEKGDLGRWDLLLERSGRASPFHRRAAVELLTKRYETPWYPLIGYEGQVPVEQLPPFETKRGRSRPSLTAGRDQNRVHRANTYRN